MEPEIIIPNWLYRGFIRANRNLTFVYSTDVNNYSNFGQAFNCKDEPNAYFIPTIWRLCKGNTQRFFTDYQFELTKPLIDNAIKRIPLNNPIIVLPRLGMGCANLQEKAPLTLEYINKELSKIKYPNIKIDIAYTHDVN